MRRARRRSGGPRQDTAGPRQDTGGSPQDTGGPPEDTENSIAERAAGLATEVTEAERPEERRRLTAAFGAAARSSARATGRGARATGRGVQKARRRAGTGMGWFTGQVVAM